MRSGADADVRVPVQRKKEEKMVQKAIAVKRMMKRKRAGMEMVQVAILVAIAIIIGLIFKSEITEFVNRTLESLNTGF